MEDYTGSSHGRLTVIGLARIKASDGARWIVRCQCGYYELRATRDLRNSKTDDCCGWCKRTKIISQKDARKGVSKRYDNSASYRYWETQPKLRDPEVHELDLAELIGSKCGAVTIIGPLADEKSWLIRCDCGRYEPRRRRSLRKPTYYFMRCQKCERLYQEAKKSNR